MKILIALSVLVALTYSSAKPSEAYRGCRLVIGNCVQECEVGTHAYSVGCGYRMSEATCDEPNPKRDKHMMCDFSACYCDAPTVRDTRTNTCVDIKDCPKSEPKKEENKTT